METISCNLCGSNKQTPMWTGLDWTHGCPGSFQMVQCADCGLIYLNPRPTPSEIGEYYPNDYEPYLRTRRTSHSSIKELIQRIKLRSRVRVVTQLVPEGRLLDVGCGSGGYLREMQRLPKWQVQGIDISTEAARFVRTQLGIDAFAGTLEDANFPDNSFDVLTMWDVLEHMHDPLATLGEVHRILKPGGYLVCSTPNATSLDAKIFGRYWIGLDFPRHLYLFSPTTLEALLVRAGLQVGDFFCFYGRYTTFALSLSRWLNAHISTPRVQRSLGSFLQFPLFRYFTLPYFFGLDKLKRGAIITVTARKAP